MLRDNPPPMLGDNGLARILDRLFDPAGPSSPQALLVGVRMSERTLERRCAAATGRSPAQLGRWYRSLAVRSALARGDRPSDVATRFGFSTTSSMRRALGPGPAPDEPPVTVARGRRRFRSASMSVLVHDPRVS
ncbi:helix-turn-helix domain-containing protein [Curtobacterium flaccumfaciens]|nr:helix-turn-helix domain-containing protein [Curtobacterium flaccumfaciens]